MSDAAVKVLGVLERFAALDAPGELAEGLRQRAEAGLGQRDGVLTWGDSTAVPDRPTRSYFDLTGWECTQSAIRLEHVVPVTIECDDDGAPRISTGDQRLLLLQGLGLARELATQVHTLKPPVPVRFIIDANRTNATFRFHRIRPGEEWNLPDLDTYRDSEPIVIDIGPLDRIG